MTTLSKSTFSCGVVADGPLMMPGYDSSWDVLSQKMATSRSKTKHDYSRIIEMTNRILNGSNEGDQCDHVDSSIKPDSVWNSTRLPIRNGKILMGISDHQTSSACKRIQRGDNELNKDQLSSMVSGLRRRVVITNEQRLKKLNVIPEADQELSGDDKTLPRRPNLLDGVPTSKSFDVEADQDGGIIAGRQLHLRNTTIPEVGNCQDQLQSVDLLKFYKKNDSEGEHGDIQMTDSKNLENAVSGHVLRVAALFNGSCNIGKFA